jgi:hypothetical protein
MAGRDVLHDGLSPELRRAFLTEDHLVRVHAGRDSG